MPVFIELTTDAFEENFRRQLEGSQASGGDVVRSVRAGATNVRRPTRGIEIKEDTYALIKVVRADGREIPLFDSSSSDGRSTSYSNFLLQQVQEMRAEKSQLVQTFGDNYIFFFGEDPRFLNCSAILLNTHDFNWRAEWWANYNTYLRGTKLVELGARIYMFYDDIIVEGYMMNAKAQEDATNSPYHIQLQFQLFVTNYQNISLIGDPNFPVRSSVVIPDSVVLTRGDAGADLTAIFRGESFDAVQAANATQQQDTALGSGAGATSGDGQGFNESFSFPEGAGAGGGAQNSSQNPLASGSRITKILQSVPISFGVSQQWWDFITTNATYEEQFNLKKIIQRSHNPLRSKISDNWDEFVGNPDTAGADVLATFGFNVSEDRPNVATKGTIINQFEAEDLFRETIQFLSCFGADVNNPDAMLSLGLSVGFGVNGAGFGAESHASANIFGNSTSSSGISDGFDPFAQDPLAAIYGAINSDPNQLSRDRNKYTEGAGDPLYGYPSDFANGPGFGQSGFGDLGGFGFGSALGETGDPGFKDPDKFTNAGVSDNRGAFDRFIAPKEDQTALTVSVGAGIGVGVGGIEGGAGVSVGGKPTAFALISVPGNLDEEGRARQRAEDIAARQAAQKFGFSVDNPFGVDCAADTGGLGFSKSFTLP